MKIFVKPFHTEFEVKPTNKNMIKTYQMQLAIAKSQDLAVMDDVVEQLTLATNMTTTVVNYLDNILSLNEKQRKAVDNWELSQTVETANYIAMRLMGMSDKDIKLAQQKDEKVKK